MGVANFSARDVLDQLDDDARRGAAFFPDFDHGYYYHVDCRLSAYADARRWVVVIEQLAVNPRSGAGVGGMAVNLYYHGNAVRLEPEPGWGDKAVRTVEPLRDGSAPLLIGDSSQDVNPSAADVRIRGRLVPIRTDPDYYRDRNIDVETLTHNRIAGAEKHLHGDGVQRAVESYEQMRSSVNAFELNTWHLLRGLVPEHRDALLSTDDERRAGLPVGLPQLLKIDGWDHPRLLEGELPSGRESFKLVAKVLAAGDPTLYQPSPSANTHWSHWPESGHL